MITRTILLALVLSIVTADLPPVNSRQQRIVRRPQEFSSGPRPGGPPPPPPRGPRPVHGPPSPKPVPPPPASFNSRPPSPPNKKQFFNPPRPKLPSPPRTSDKTQPQVEYGFTPIVAPNGFNNAAPSQQENNPAQSETKPLVINVQPASFQNNNQQKINFSQQGGFGQGQVFVEKPNEQHSFDQVKKQNFGPNNRNKNSEPFPKIPPNFSHFGGENNNNNNQNFDSVPKPSGNVQVQKVPLVASFQTTSIGQGPISQSFNKPAQPQNPNFNINKPQNPNFNGNKPQLQNPNFNANKHQSQNPNFNANKPQLQNPNFNVNKPQNPNFNVNKPQNPNFNANKPQNPNFNVHQGQRVPQFQDGSKNFNAGVQFQVQSDPKFPVQNKNIQPNFPQGGPQQHFINNFGPEKKFQTQGNLGQGNLGQGNFGQQNIKQHGGQFLQETTQNQGVNFAANNVNFQVQHPKIPQYFGPEIKVIPQQPLIQDPKFANPQFFNQDPKILSAGIPVGAQFTIPQNQQFIVPQNQHNQQLHAQYQVQAEAPQYFPTQFKIPAAPQIYGQKSIGNQDQISIPVATTFPFGLSNNPFNKGIVQGQVIPVGHLGAAGIPQFTALPQTLQYAGLPTVQQSLGKEQEVSASQTLRKIIAPPRNTSAISPAKSKKTTLKDILAEDCTGAEEFGYCASPPRYPTLQVTAILKQCSEQIQELYEPESVVPAHHISERANTEAWSWSAYDNGGAEGTEGTCESTAAIVEPGYARDANGHWLVILQHQSSNVHQRVNVDVCAHEGGSCGCEQKYESKNLIAWDPDTPNQCPIIKSFKFPTKCICPGEKTES